MDKRKRSKQRKREFGFCWYAHVVIYPSEIMIKERRAVHKISCFGNVCEHKTRRQEMKRQI
jgi:hypothetical protein